MQVVSTERHTEPMHYLPEVDLYGLIHKGIRFAFSDLLTRLGRVEPQDDVVLRAIFADLEELLLVLVSHAAHEEAHLHRAIEARLSGGAKQLAGDHVSQEREIEALHVMIGTCEALRGSARIASLRALYLAFATFAGENLVHMSCEESYAQPLLEQLYSRAELEAIHVGLLESLTPEEMQRGMKLIERAAKLEALA